MNYEYLSDRKTGSATQNFRLFIEDLVSQSPETAVTPSTRAYRDHGLLKDYEFPSSDALQRYTVFQRLLARRGKSQDTT